MTARWYSEIVALLMLFMVGAAHAAPLASVKATYDIYKGKLRVGQISEVYTRNKDRYTLTSTTRAVGLLAIFRPGKINIKSSGAVTPSGLQPTSFSDLRNGEDAKNHRAEFDWDSKKLTLIRQPQNSVIALPDGTQDRLSAMYQFMFLSLGKSDTLSFNMTNGGKLDTYSYRITPNQSVTTPLGTFGAYYLVSAPEAGAGKTEIWLVAEQHNFPYKMTITDKEGDKLTQVLTEIDFTQ
jgi:hypothetical protein